MMLKLVSFKLCPYVQRALIALLYKGVEHEIEYVDLAKPPDWFLRISPLKKVPVLMLDDTVLFESNAIVEFVDEAYPNRLHPEDILARARNRSWMAFGDVCMPFALQLTLKKTQAEFDRVAADLMQRFDELEPAVRGDGSFNRTGFSLIDVCFAPLFMRLEFLDRIAPGVLDPERHPRISAWRDGLSREPSVKHSCVADIELLYMHLLGRRQGYVAGFLDEEFRVDAAESRIY